MDKYYKKYRDLFHYGSIGAGTVLPGQLSIKLREETLDILINILSDNTLKEFINDEFKLMQNMEKKLLNLKMI